MRNQIQFITEPMDWLKAIESRARDRYAECRARSARRAAAGAPSLEEMREDYRSLVEYGGEFIPTDHFSTQRALEDAMDEEYIASRGVEECIRQALEDDRYDRMSSNQARPFPLLPMSNN